MKCDKTTEKPAECSKMLLSAKTKQNNILQIYHEKKKRGHFRHGSVAYYSIINWPQTLIRSRVL